MSENVILLASNNMNAKLANAINEEANKQGLSSQIVKDLKSTKKHGLLTKKQIIIGKYHLFGQSN